MQLPFSKEEIRDIIISIIVVTIIFSYVRAGANLQAIMNLIPDALIVVVIAFFFHEMAHKFVARKFGAAAIYKMWPQGLLIGLLVMFVGFVIVAPGAVVIHPYRFGRWGFKMGVLNPREMGIIALAGPAVNITFAAIFSAIFSAAPHALFGLLAFINGFLALFNLLPIPPLDGSKVFMWKTWLWLVLFLASIFLVLPYIIR